MVPETVSDIKEMPKMEMDEDSMATTSGLLNSTNGGFPDPNTIPGLLPVKSRYAQKRRLGALCKNENLDRSKVKMMDLIYLNGTLEPMASKYNKKLVAELKTEIKTEQSSDDNLKNGKEDRTMSIQSNNDECISDERSNPAELNEDAANDDADNDNFMDNMPVTQLKFNSQGEIVMDHESLKFETSAKKRARDFMANSKLVVIDEDSPRPNYHKRQGRRRDWYIEETKKFYRCLQVIGTDFGMMVSFFPDRDRRSLKLKFKREERINPQLVDKVILNPKEFNIDELKAQIAQDEEDLKARIATKAEVAAKNLLEIKAKKRRSKEKIKLPTHSAAHRILSGSSVYDEEAPESTDTEQMQELESATTLSADVNKPRKRRVFKCKKVESVEEAEVSSNTEQESRKEDTSQVVEDENTVNDSAMVKKPRKCQDLECKKIETIKESEVNSNAEQELEKEDNTKVVERKEDTSQVVEDENTVNDSAKVKKPRKGQNMKCKKSETVKETEVNSNVEQESKKENNTEIVENEATEEGSVKVKKARKGRVVKCKKTKGRKRTKINSNSEQESKKEDHSEVAGVETTENNTDALDTVNVSEIITPVEITQVSNAPMDATDNNSVDNLEIDLKKKQQQYKSSIENMRISILCDEGPSVVDKFTGVVDNNNLQCSDFDKKLNDLINNSQDDVIIIENLLKSTIGEDEITEACETMDQNDSTNINDLQETSEQLQTYNINDVTESVTFNMKQLETDTENTIEIIQTDEQHTFDKDSNKVQMPFSIFIEQDTSVCNNVTIGGSNLRRLTLDEELNRAIDNTQDDVIIIENFLKSSFPEDESMDEGETMDQNESINNYDIAENNEQLQSFIIDDVSANAIFDVNQLRRDSQTSISNIETIETIEIANQNTFDENNSNKVEMPFSVFIEQDSSVSHSAKIGGSNLRRLTLDEELNRAIDNTQDDVIIIENFLKSSFPEDESMDEGETMDQNESINNNDLQETSEQLETFIIESESENVTCDLKPLERDSDSSLKVQTFNMDSIEKIDLCQDSSDDEGLAALKRDLTATTETVLETILVSTSKKSPPKKRKAQKKRRSMR